MKSRAAIALLTLAVVAVIATAILLKKPMATSPVQATTAAAHVGRASCAACHGLISPPPSVRPTHVPGATPTSLPSGPPT